MLLENTARTMGDAPKEIKVRHIGSCLKADPDYCAVVAKALDIPLSDVGELKTCRRRVDRFSAARCPIFTC